MARLAGRLLAFGGDADFFSDYQDSELQNGKCLTQIKFLQLFPFKFYLSLPILLHFATLPRPRNGTPWQPDWLNRGMGSGGGKVNINEIFTNLSLSQYLTFKNTVYQREYINPCNVSQEFSRKQNSFFSDGWPATQGWWKQGLHLDILWNVNNSNNNITMTLTMTMKC